MLCDERRFAGVDILSPLGRVLIGSIPYIREETEFQVIVCVDQSGQQQITREVDAAFRLVIDPMMDGRSVPDRMKIFAHNGNRRRCGCIRSQRAARSGKTDCSGGALDGLFGACGTWVLSQLQNIDCRKSRGGFIEVEPPALFEDLPLFETEGRFDQRNQLKSTLQEGE